MATPLDTASLFNECRVQAKANSCPGGSIVNKVSTRIELRFNIENSETLSEPEKAILIQKLGKSLPASGDIIIVSQEERSQYKNKERAIEKLLLLLEKYLKPEKPRHATKPSKASKEKRLQSKRIRSLAKEKRKPPDLGE